MSKHELHHRVVIITGAAAGIGWGIAQTCAQAGASVVLADVDDATDRERTLQAQGLMATYIPLDVRDPSAINRFIEKVLERFGHIDGLVNNAGVTLAGDFLAFDVDGLDRLWEVNQRSVFLLCQAAAQHMQPGATIVNIASNHAGASAAGYEMYAATKGAIVAMTRAMAWSLGKRGIRVNSLCPGLTKTEAVESVVEKKPHLARVFEDMHADHQYNTVEEVGDIAVFMLSSCSGAITGASITADHGLSASLCSTGELK